MKTIVVIGGGISGLAAAYVLGKKGYNVTVIERSEGVGGLAKTFRYKDYLLDYGPHNFHTHIPGVFDFVKSELGIEMNRLPIRTSKLYFMGKFIDYPIKIVDAVRNLDLFTAFMCCYDWFVARVKARLGGKKEKEDSFEEWIVKKFGRHLYNLYFGPYVKKVWGIPGTELDVSVAKQRIPEPSLFALLLRLVTGIKLFKRHSEDPSTVESYYPPKGIGVISDKLASGILERGGRIELNSVVEEIETDRNGHTVRYAKNGSKLSVECDYIINTIPINTFTAMLKGRQPDASVKTGIERSQYRSLVLLYLFLNVENVFDSPWVYFNEQDNADLIFNRIYEVGSFSKEMVPEGRGALCLEITCYRGDALWNKSDAELYAKCMEYLEKRGFLKKEQVAEYITKRLGDVYPVFRVDYSSHVRNLMDYITKDNNIFAIGRQGLFTYANMDHCIDMGLRLGGLFDGEPTGEKFFSLYKDYLKTGN